MEIYSIENLTFRYPETDIDILKDITFSVSSGEFITICGLSGSGKSTLLRQLKTCLQPFGERSGKIYFEGNLLSETDFETQTRRIGFVMQSPDNQSVTDKVWHELAFGLESLSVDTPTIRKRVAEMASFFGIEKWLEKSTDKLSGGQKQILNLASVMIMQPTVLILDESTSQLDPIASGEFISALRKINTELGTTIILSEHCLDGVFAISDRIIVMSDGKIISNETPQKTGGILFSEKNEMFSAMPSPVRIFSFVEGNKSESPLTVSEGRKWLEKYTQNIELNPVKEDEKFNHTDTPVIEMKNIWFRYERNLPDILHGTNLKAYKGEFLAILGGNGTGKSTMLSVITGVNKAYRGKVYINGQDISKSKKFESGIAMLPQNPQTLFVKNTVEEDLYDIFSGRKIPKEIQKQKIEKVILLCGLEKFLSRHPYDLSGGEQQKAALAKVLLTEPKILLLDEPTKGLDIAYKKKFAETIKGLVSDGIAVIMVSHDIEFCAEYADRCAMFFNGEMVSENTPRAFFADNSFYTTSSNRMSRGIIKNAVTENDILYAVGKSSNINNKNKRVKKDNTVSKDKQTPKFDKIKEINTEKVFEKKPKLSKKITVAICMIFLAIPITILAGMYWFGNEKYLFISLVVMLECMLPFFLLFEKRKVQAREIVLIAVLCALCVSGRIVFYMLPQFKPVAALIIISGIALGGESGFLIGAVTILVSNMFFGQGIWTPWQIFSMGIIGFISGVLYRKKILPKNRISFAVFGFLSIVLIYGGIMNPASLIISQSEINISSLTAIYISGLPMDIIHGLSTAVFLFLGAEAILGKLERIKIKYGLIC